MNRRQKLFLTIVSLVCAIVLASLAFASLVYESEEEDGVRVVATFYALAYMAEAIGGEKVTVKTLIPQNTDAHSWEPSTADILEVNSADVIVYNGAGLEPWFEDEILPALDTEGKIVVDTTQGLGLILASSDGGTTYDPHTWLSPFMAHGQAERIYVALASADPGNESYYSERWGQLDETLESLDTDYTELLSTKNKSDIFVGHSAYSYLAQRYGFEQHGIIGLAADESPSASTIASLVDMMIEHDIYVVYVDPLYREDYATALSNSLQEQTGHEVGVLSLYLMVGFIDGLDLIGQMEANLQSLAVGLEAG